MNNYFNSMRSTSYEAIINLFDQCQYLEYITLPPNNTSFRTWGYIYFKKIYKNFKYINDGIDLSKFVFIVH